MRIAFLVLIILLTIYAPIELSRLIIWNDYYHIGSGFIFELCFIWIFYITGMAIVYKLIKELKDGS